jgi:stalled ribosome rescue protein Dom34
MPFAHAIVWIDHHTARVIEVSRDQHRVTEIVATPACRQVHRKSGIIGSGHHGPDRAFLDEVADAVEGVDEIIVTGPGVAKRSFERHLGERRPGIACHIVAVEPSDHPSDGQLVAHARREFRRIDQLGGVTH